MEQHQPSAQDAIALTKQLITIPSVSDDEAEILSFVAKWMDQAGFDQVITKERFTAGLIRGKSKASQPAGKALLLCGHIDTVPAGDESAWQGSPWRPRTKGDRLYGLGASDMKSGVAIQMIAAQSYLTERRDDLDLWCVAVAHEEVDGAGSADFTKYFAQNTSYDQASCIIAEPTDQRIELGHRGNRFVQLLFEGKSGHASRESAYSTSSLPPLITFMNDLIRVRLELHRTYYHPALGEPTFTPTRIEPAGVYSSNKTASASYIAVDIRTTPELDQAFDSWLDQLASKYHFSWRYVADPVPSALCDKKASILRAMQHILPKASTAVSFGATDQAFFQAIGIQTIIYGPGDFAQAHAINESVSLARIKDTYRVYRQLIRQIYAS